MHGLHLYAPLNHLFLKDMTSVERTVYIFLNMYMQATITNQAAFWPFGCQNCYTFCLFLLCLSLLLSRFSIPRSFFFHAFIVFIMSLILSQRITILVIYWLLLGFLIHFCQFCTSSRECLSSFWRDSCHSYSFGYELQGHICVLLDDTMTWKLLNPPTPYPHPMLPAVPFTKGQHYETLMSNVMILIKLYRIQVGWVHMEYIKLTSWK